MIRPSVLIAMGFKPTVDHCYGDNDKAFKYELYKAYFLIHFYDGIIEIELIGNLKVGFHARKVKTVKELFAHIVEISQLVGQEKYKAQLHDFLN